MCVKNNLWSDGEIFPIFGFAVQKIHKEPKRSGKELSLDLITVHKLTKYLEMMQM